MFKRRKDMFKFSVKKHSVIGMISFILGIISCLTLLVLSYISSLTAGNGGIILGVIGVLLFGISVVGLALGIKACKEKEIYYTGPIVGLALNGFISVIYFILYLVGISL